jgi:hypothetical protein
MISCFGPIAAGAADLIRCRLCNAYAPHHKRRFAAGAALARQRAGVMIVQKFRQLLA